MWSESQFKKNVVVNFKNNNNSILKETAIDIMKAPLIKRKNEIVKKVFATKEITNDFLKAPKKRK